MPVLRRPVEPAGVERKWDFEAVRSESDPDRTVDHGPTVQAAPGIRQSARYCGSGCHQRGGPLAPINATVAQPPPIHFFSKFVGVLLHAVARKAIATARLHIRFDLPPNVFVKCQ